MIIDGNDIAEHILSELRRRPTPRKELSAILIGGNPASVSFLRQKEKTARSLGVRFRLYRFPASLPQKKLEAAVRAISKNRAVGGVIVQLPIPKKFNRVPILNAIGIEKDIDVLNGETTSVLAPASGALRRIFEEIGFNPRGKRAVVLGPGLLVGRPIASWLMDKVVKLTILGKTKLDVKTLREADLVVSGTGVPRLISGAHLKRGAVAIDYGYGRIKGVVSGDFDFESVKRAARHITPTPGGTGPIVVAELFRNFYDLNSA